MLNIGKRNKVERKKTYSDLSPAKFLGLNNQVFQRHEFWNLNWNEARPSSLEFVLFVNDRISIPL
jgi:hypothetical protein